jgi:cysteine desulfuration protein SufE
MTHIIQAQQAIIDKFDFLDDWMEKYQLIIGLGKQTQDFPEKKKTSQYLIKGCQSQVWFDSWLEGGRLQMHGTSDAAIVSGLMAILFSVYNNQTPQDILDTAPDFIEEIGLHQHLSPTRSNGLNSMIQAIYKAAHAALG